MTLTHTCDNALGDTCTPSPLASRWNGLSVFGRHAVRELNRLGVMVDLSHVSPQTASDALSLSTAPVIFSHSNARGVHPHPRNVPDSILRRIGKLTDPHRAFNLSRDGERGVGWGADTNEVDKVIPGGDALVCLNFSPDFISDTRANVSSMADHADYIARLAGKEHVAIGSDFDGILSVPDGLEDVSKYPALVAELIRRGWSDREIVGLAGGASISHFPHGLRQGRFVRRQKLNGAPPSLSQVTFYAFSTKSKRRRIICAISRHRPTAL